MSLDLKDFFLATPMKTQEYMKVPSKYFPNDIQEKYNLREKIHKEYVFIKIKKGMYGLKQAAVLAYKNLIKKLVPFSYEPIPHTDSYWRHKQNPSKFCLCVDNFGVKYFSKTDLNHLITALQTKYKISTDFTCQNYCGLTINWNYEEGFVDISMHGYVTKVIKKFDYTPKIPQYSPHEYFKQKYGTKVQYARKPDEFLPTNKKDTRKVQSVAGTFLYYSRA